MFETPIGLGAPRTHGAWKTFTFASLSASWRWLTTGRYTRTLEDEVERLRVENRALLNSLLGTAGFPPIHPDTVGTSWQARVPPVRRRSWHQLAARREWEAAAPAEGGLAPSPKSPTRQSRFGDGARYGGGENAPPPPKGPFH